MMPFGSEGGCQTTLTDVRRTSGNTNLTGGPGTEEKRGRERERGYMHLKQITVAYILISCNVAHISNTSKHLFVGPSFYLSHDKYDILISSHTHTKSPCKLLIP